MSKYGKLRDEEFFHAVRLDRNDPKTLKELMTLCNDLKGPWPSFQDAERTGIHYRLMSLLENHERPDI